MSANVETMFSVKQTPWHKLGRVIPARLTPEESLREAGMDWLVAKRPIYIDGTNEGEVDEVPSYFATVRTDKNHVLGVVGSQFEPVQNHEAIEFFNTITGESKAIMETAGVLAEGRKVWWLAKLPGEIRVVGDDITEKYFLFANGHDGLFNLALGFTPIRVVCQNTLNAALRNGSNWVRLRHTQGIRSNLETAANVIKAGVDYFTATGEAFQAMAKKELRKANVEGYFRRVYERPAELDTVKGRWNHLDTLTSMFETGRGNDMAGVRGTLWAAYNAVTQFEDYDRETRKETNRLERNWFGAGAALKAQAFSVAQRILVDGEAALN